MTAGGLAPMSAPLIRRLATLEDCRKVVELEKKVWEYTDAEDVVPAPVLDRKSVV